jgi:Ca2+-transporting ATPase
MNFPAPIKRLLGGTGTAPSEQAPAIRWHALDAEQALHELGSDAAHGLPESQARQRGATYGRNVLTVKRPRGPLLRLLLQFHQPLVYILLLAASVTAFLQEWVDASVILGVVLVNAVIGFVQESKAAQAIEALSRRMQAEATVLRDGQRVRMAAADLVPGDIVLLSAGDRVPADLRLLRAKELQIDESALTGESVPSQKSEHPVAADTELADRSSMAYVTTMVTRGYARAVVTAIGDATEIGHISTLMSTAEQLQTPLTKKIAGFSHLLVVAILGLAAITFALGLARGQDAFEVFMAAVALTVGAIPEGLPAAITIMLAMGVSRMATRRAIIRKLPAVETLGSTTVICSDKTGTLTENQMTVVRAAAQGQSYEFTGIGYEPKGEVTRHGAHLDWPQHLPLQLCLKAGLLCNDSSLVCREGRWFVEGDPTEGALIAAAHKGGFDRDALEEQEPRLDLLPFESERQYMATLHQRVGGDRVAYVKGSVEALLKRCSQTLGKDGAVVELDEGGTRAEADELASQGLRVLAFAYKPMGSSEGLSHGAVEQGLVFLGLQGIVDPPRPEAKEAIRQCLGAGIGVKMITGDNPLTASNIARQLGLTGDGDEETATIRGAELADMDDEQLQRVVEQVHVFARVNPEQKLRLVRALQARGQVAAMTGDGVNDAPALRRADIGIAMGISGTDVAKGAADMVLTDDNFATIEAAVEEGRSVFDNLTKFIVWTLPTNLGEALIILIAAVLGTTLPITPVQILWINMTTAVLLGLMLGFEPKEKDIMSRPPRPRDEPLLTFDLIMRTCFVGSLLLASGYGSFQLMLHWGTTEAAARTTAVNAIVIGELFYLFNCRSLVKPVTSVGLWTNPWVFVGSGAMLAVQVLFVYAPFMNTLFDTAPLGVAPWALVFASGASIFALVNIEKRIRRHATGGGVETPDRRA